MQGKKQRITQLTELLDEAARVYEQEDREIMSNFEYDKLYDELKKLEEETGIVLAGSPTRKVGYEILSELPKERHESAMLSLDKTKEVPALIDWLGNKEGILSWKMDGLTIVLTYRNGELVKAVTRGNGEVGEVVTNNAKVFKNLPLTIPYEGELIIRGEAVIRYSDFEMINAQIPDADAKYKNPRNLCSGSVRQLNNAITAKRNVNFFAFALIRMDEMNRFKTMMEQFNWLKELGFDVVEEKLVTAENMAETMEYFESHIITNDFPSDGLVLFFNDIAYGESLGRTSKFPRNGIAFKWRDEIKETTLQEIEWSASRTGLINPVAIFEPVELEGTTVSRASLHNISIMEGLELGLGDKVTVYKANMIIPQIADNLTRSGHLPIPKTCPVCGGDTMIKQDSDVKSLYCMNPECLAKKIKSFTHFVSRDAMNIEGLSEATIEKLIAKGLIKELADIFHVKDFKEEITTMEGFGEKSFRNLVDSVEKARTPILAKFIYSLGIANVGLANAKLICKEFGYDFNKVSNATVDELTQIPQIGYVIAEAFVSYFQKPENKLIIEDLLKEITFEKEEAAGGSEKLKGLTFVITGSVEHFTNRNEVKDVIEQHGGKVTGSVTAKTNYLINNDNTSSSSKNKKARELGIPVITEEEFIQLLNEA
ncbi:NAD-dependent DNA ligase LigA [Lachnoclostridium phytofermentans]|uniref:DNA ligase n=1 Tax=Lachnoclostridium phytofermentans (strain ATCC 700394 / DSM 18823 / ISDg) TaxID=357809 RepID=DNLJ_LACP7|nr:NAD-dependent DNA ligase LigA [Lachnoclostridium phytofermentans]A9KPL0.1 RecName: Full=DNA ligase; AltName: Full=Polydeoxyribonucleotide synthase [NAD(+)] [Lachnoclostridium phytofermentans ISDg]ABX43284.1 DNA ligase, NAD-dependent [Lachnoclostridium phytofermentans ISDg]